MEKLLAFGEILKVVDTLPLEEQETLIEVVHRRVVEQRQAKLAKEIRDAQKEFQAGHCYTMTPDELVAEILS